MDGQAFGNAMAAGLRALVIGVLLAGLGIGGCTTGVVMYCMSTPKPTCNCKPCNCNPCKCETK